MMALSGQALPERRRLLQSVCLAGATGFTGTMGLPAWGKENALVLPAPASLQDALADALRQQLPLVVMVSLDGCPFCKTVRQNYLGPLLTEDKLPIVQIDMRSKRALQDFQGKATTHDELVQGWKVRVAPTLLFVGAGGRELAPRLVGAGLPDFFGAYLEQRLLAARQALKSS